MHRDANAPAPIPGYETPEYGSLLFDALAFFELLTPDLRVVFEKGSDYDLVQAFPVQVVVARKTTKSLQWGLLAVAEVQYQRTAEQTRGNLALRNTLGVGEHGLGGYVDVGAQHRLAGPEFYVDGLVDRPYDRASFIVGAGLMIMRLDDYGVSLGYRVDLAEDLVRHSLGVSVDFPFGWFVGSG